LSDVPLLSAAGLDSLLCEDSLDDLELSLEDLDESLDDADEVSPLVFVLSLDDSLEVLFFA